MGTPGFVAHSAKDLRYRLIPGHVSLVPLRVLRTRDIVALGWNVRFVILGASHAVVLERDDIALTELLTCMPPVCHEPTDDGFELAVPRATEAFSLPRGAGIDGSRVTLGLFALSQGDAFEAIFDSDCRLEVEFPFLGQKDPASAIPLTRIGWRVTIDGLTVETIHTYPEEAIGVRSRTSFVLTAKAGEENV